VFLGNYINRGPFNVETLIYVLAFKLNYPKDVILLRGPMETKKMCEYYGFKEECVSKYSEIIYDLFMEVLNRLPLACVINQLYFCVSGGISPDCETIDKIGSIQRVGEIPRAGVMSDLIWSDPASLDQCDMIKTFEGNAEKDSGYIYGPVAVENFMVRNNILCII
jgi:serine/threonine-protein phosphatase 2B catalytic subunit